mmetsp:Transcript_33210/g.64850  ORF Transcript_33210/g.64850 Transcript_33210/m.64850 type:complete len:284 (+) Transcript_33210:372-1223(+)
MRSAASTATATIKNDDENDIKNDDERSLHLNHESLLPHRPQHPVHLVQRRQRPPPVEERHSHPHGQERATHEVPDDEGGEEDEEEPCHQRVARKRKLCRSDQQPIVREDNGVDQLHDAQQRPHGGERHELRRVEQQPHHLRLKDVQHRAAPHPDRQAPQDDPSAVAPQVVERTQRQQVHDRQPGHVGYAVDHTARHHPPQQRNMVCHQRRLPYSACQDRREQHRPLQAREPHHRVRALPRKIQHGPPAAAAAAGVQEGLVAPLHVAEVLHAWDRREEGVALHQ